MSDRRSIRSGSQWEERGGYCRAVVVGRRVFVAGTAPSMPGDADPPPDAYGQTRRCFEIVEEALREAGGGLEHVVRTRMLLAEASVAEEVLRAHHDLFADVRPVNTSCVVGLLDPRWHVEIEVDAVLPRDPRAPAPSPGSAR